MLKKMATEIYSELITGKYINSKTLSTENKFIDNELYTEIDKDIYKYEEFYDTIGYNLVHNTEYGYFHLTKQDNTDDDEKTLDKNIIKEYILSVCLCRYLFDKGKSADILFDPDAGITEEEIEDFVQEERFKKIFGISDINTQHNNPVNIVFEKRNIFIKNKKGNYVGTGIFKHFVDEQEKLGEKIIQENA